MAQFGGERATSFDAPLHEKLNFTGEDVSLEHSEKTSPMGSNRRSMEFPRTKKLLARNSGGIETGSLRDAAEYINKRRYGGGAFDQSDSDDEAA